jgi:hypothetical protein
VATGGCVSCTVTANEQLSSFPALSLAVQSTAVVPLENRVPEGGAHVTDAMPQLSDALAENVTTASQRPDSVTVKMFAGQAIAGFSRSCTITPKVHRFVFPLVSVATHVTGV